MSEEDPTYPFRRCIEEMIEEARHFSGNMTRLCDWNENGTQFAGAKQAATMRIKAMFQTIDKYELRKELDI